MPDPNDKLVDLHFPKSGVDLSLAFGKQMNRPAANGEYARTTPIGINVRGFEAMTLRSRGGTRAGLARYIAAPVADWLIQHIQLLVTSGTTSVQTNQSGRVVFLVAVSQGSVFTAQPGDTSWTSTINGTVNAQPLAFSGIVYSAANNQKLWFADGSNYVYYDPTTNTVTPWVASHGVLPVDSAGNTPRLIVTWRGRTCASGLLLDPQNWFMSAVSDPTDWDYSGQTIPPATTKSQTNTQAIAGNNSPLGLIGDVVTTMIPYTDDTMIFGGDHSIYIMSGDPLAGGQLDLVTNTIGMAWGIPWCMDPYGTIYFVSNRMGVYSFIPGQAPQRISQPIEQLLLNINTGLNNIRLIWDDRFQGLHIFITLLSAPAACTHMFWESRSGAWWQDQFANNDYNPLAVCQYDGNTPGDRAVLIGGWDGIVRAVSPTATTDDGAQIASDVWIGPLLTPQLDEMLAKECQAVLGLNSGLVTWEIHVGDTAEEALQSVPFYTGTWIGDVSGRQLSEAVRASGHAVYVRLTSTAQWALESIRLRIATTGKVRMRGR